MNDDFKMIPNDQLPDPARSPMSERVRRGRKPGQKTKDPKKFDGQLNRRDFARKKPVTPRKALEWALENVAYKDVQTKDAPSALAWTYLQAMRNNKDFLEQSLLKLVPTKGEVDLPQKYRDDAEKQIYHIEKLLEEDSRDEVLSPVPQEYGTGESSVPPAASSSGN